MDQLNRVPPLQSTRQQRHADTKGIAGNLYPDARRRPWYTAGLTTFRTKVPTVVSSQTQWWYINPFFWHLRSSLLYFTFSLSLSRASLLRVLGHCPISVSLRTTNFVSSILFTRSHATDTRHSAARAPLVGDSRIYEIISSMPPLLFCTFEMVVYECGYLTRYERLWCLFLSLFNDAVSTILCTTPLESSIKIYFEVLRNLFSWYCSTYFFV